jgi:NAD(P)-dependent dehydrogenase (short-subunit alcohol dehydrogenase family)
MEQRPLALVTGASSGIGRALAREFARQRSSTSSNPGCEA